jgi:hypothetical protein
VIPTIVFELQQRLQQVQLVFSHSLQQQVSNSEHQRAFAYLHQPFRNQLCPSRKLLFRERLFERELLGYLLLGHRMDLRHFLHYLHQFTH